MAREHIAINEAGRPLISWTDSTRNSQLLIYLTHFQSKHRASRYPTECLVVKHLHVVYAFLTNKLFLVEIRVIWAETKELQQLWFESQTVASKNISTRSYSLIICAESDSSENGLHLHLRYLADVRAERGSQWAGRLRSPRPVQGHFDWICGSLASTLSLWMRRRQQPFTRRNAIDSEM